MRVRVYGASAGACVRGHVQLRVCVRVTMGMQAYKKRLWRSLSSATKIASDLGSGGGF